MLVNSNEEWRIVNIYVDVQHLHIWLIATPVEYVIHVTAMCCNVREAKNADCRSMHMGECREEKIRMWCFIDDMNEAILCCASRIALGIHLRTRSLSFYRKLIM